MKFNPEIYFFVPFAILASGISGFCFRSLYFDVSVFAILLLAYLLIGAIRVSIRTKNLVCSFHKLGQVVESSFGCEGAALGYVTIEKTSGLCRVQATNDCLEITRSRRYRVAIPWARIDSLDFVGSSSRIILVTTDKYTTMEIVVPWNETIDRAAKNTEFNLSSYQ